MEEGAVVDAQCFFTDLEGFPFRPKHDTPNHDVPGIVVYLQ